MNQIEKTQIRVGHSPDPDDAFMFYALARETIDTGQYQFSHELVDIETLNRRAFEADLELTALSLHAYAYLADKYAICACGASMGDKYGPMVVAREQASLTDLNDATIAIPGTLTTAYLALRMCMGVDFKYVVVPFDEILNVVEAGSFEGEEVHAGLIIREGQLTYGSQDLKLVVDLGVWWDEETGLPLPLGCNGIRKDMGKETMLEVTALLKESIVHGLENREPALDLSLIHI